ncbi:hypothetical protein D3C86_1351650 [compost metagenome]
MLFPKAVGSPDGVVIVTVVVAAAVGVEHGVALILLTQYVVVAVGETVIEAPVPESMLEPTVPVPHW